ncbi:MAG: transcriptional repressor, partial [Endomicrobiaceae bacterium]|nr:transcriptional repressor [Endomicrobiaceae bacterium]
YGLCHCGHDEHHHHITCIKCGKVDEITDCALHGVKKINGYKVISHFIQVNGICSECSRKS